MKVSTYRMTAGRLALIIAEELELLELQKFHSPKTGRFSSGQSGDVYSLSKPAVKAANWDSDLAKKGIVTKKGKLRARYGMADSCGRKALSGDKISPPKYSCSKFKRTYADLAKEDIIHSDNDIEDTFPGYSDLKSLSMGIYEYQGTKLYSEKFLRSALNVPIDEQGQQQGIPAKCQQLGFITKADAQNQILRSLNSFAKAQDGKLGSKD